MKVQNRKCIRRLSVKSLYANRRRNLIAIFAIALTALLFTSMFTIVLSLNASYETYQFRQLGSYAHGAFKDVSPEQLERISAHPRIKEAGVRKVIGISVDGIFARTPAEVSYMDANCTKWSYAVPTTGRMPESGKEAAMDTAALQLLDVEPELGAEVTVSYSVTDKDQIALPVTDTFTLVGYWDYDELMPVHYINISKDYADDIEAQAMETGLEPFRTDLSVMLASSADIQGQMEQVDTDLGYTWDSYTDPDSVRIGVNWGYTSSQLASLTDPGLVIAVAAFLLLVIFTGYLIIYNIFQISVTGDIRFYGLLKTIGATPRQLKRIIRQQALLLCVAGIPAGLLLGYGIGAVLVPVVLKTTQLGAVSSTISASPVIFLGSALFALLTVLLSCSRPGRMAAKVSPVEAAKYTDAAQSGKKHRGTRGARIHQMAFANLGRNKKKTVLVVLSLALSVTLFNALCSFVGSFSMEKYVSSTICADFIVSTTDYFRFNVNTEEFITPEQIREISANTNASLSGTGYAVLGEKYLWMTEDALRQDYARYESAEQLDAHMSGMEHRGDMVMGDTRIEALDSSLFAKLQVFEGELSPMQKPDNHAIAIVVSLDDYGNLPNPDYYPKVGDTVTVTYAEGLNYIDSRTGELCAADTPEEYLQPQLYGTRDVEYTVCALIKRPYSMGYRYGGIGYDAVLSVDAAQRDGSGPVIPMFYLFDTADETDEAAAEQYLSALTVGEFSPLMYESKATARAEFARFRQMFLLVGGVLCAIIGLVGLLNFCNAMMTGILSRRREFAVLQAVGMTNRQLKSMLIYEGLFYAMASVTTAFALSLVMGPLAGKSLGSVYWFFDYQFTILPVLLTVPVFLLLGWLIPRMMYRHAAKCSIVEQLRDTP
ncbi:MAG: ABC transporter permease [Eubacteriales bacterium]|nr:ABC transporter permease [Eubacteriales bacterium]